MSAAAGQPSEGHEEARSNSRRIAAGPRHWKGIPRERMPTSSPAARIPIGMATFPTGTIPRVEPTLLYGAGDPYQDAVVQACTASPLQGALFQLLH
jgi:hypothetical protein